MVLLLLFLSQVGRASLEHVPAIQGVRVAGQETLRRRRPRRGQRAHRAAAHGVELHPRTGRHHHCADHRLADRGADGDQPVVLQDQRAPRSERARERLALRRSEDDAVVFVEERPVLVQDRGELGDELEPGPGRRQRDDVVGVRVHDAAHVETRTVDRAVERQRRVDLAAAREQIQGKARLQQIVGSDLVEGESEAVAEERFGAGNARGHVAAEAAALAVEIEDVERADEIGAEPLDAGRRCVHG
jgi:hypothetical protein